MTQLKIITATEFPLRAAWATITFTIVVTIAITATT